MSLRPARGKAGAADLPSHSEAGVAAEATLCDPHGLPRRLFVSVCLSANCWYSGAPQCAENGHLLELKLAAPEKGWRPGESGLTLPIPSHLRSARPDGRDVWAGAKLPQQFRTKRNRDLYDAAHERMLQPVPGVVSTAN